MNAHCQCHHITFTTPLPAPLKIYICHCTECRFQSTSAYGITLVFPVFPFPPGLKVWTRTTFEGREKKCYFCPECGSRILHHVEGQGYVAMKGCVEGLTAETMDGAVHIWTRGAVVRVPEGVERWEGEPEGGTTEEQ